MSRKAAPNRSAEPGLKPKALLAPSDPDEALAALARTLDFAAPGRFLLAFAKCNLPVQRCALVERLKVMLEPLNVTLLEVDLTEPVTQLLPHLREQLGSTYLASTTTIKPEAELTLAVRESAGKVALFVYGLEHSLPSSDPKPPLLDHLNFSRELFRRDVPCPLVIWLPDYALTKVARGAPDFWAWRSGVFEFPPEPELAQRMTREAVYDGDLTTSNLSIEAKRERLHLLERLLEDYRELGDGERERHTRADILFKIGDVQKGIGEWTAARERYTEARNIFDKLSDQRGIAISLHQLAMLAQDTGDLAEARRLYEQSLQIARELGDTQGIAAPLHQLGRLAQDTGDLAGATRLYEQSLQIARELGDKQGVAITIWNLGVIAHSQGNHQTARENYLQALTTFQQLGDKMNSAGVLHQLGKLAQDTGDPAEARHMYQQSLQITRELGNKRNVAITLHQLAMLAQNTGDLAEARRLYEQSLQIARELDDKQGIARSLHQLGRLAQDTGDLAEARHLYEQSLQMKRELGDKEGIATSLHQLGRLAEDEGHLIEAQQFFEESFKMLNDLQSPDAKIAQKSIVRVKEQLEKRGNG